MKKYAKEQNIDISNLFEFEIDLAPFQPSTQKGDPDVIRTITISHEKDGIAGSNPMPDAKNYTTNPLPNKNAIDNHSVNSFSRQEIKRFVQKSDNNGIDSQWEQKPIK